MVIELSFCSQHCHMFSDKWVSSILLYQTTVSSRSPQLSTCARLLKLNTPLSSPCILSFSVLTHRHRFWRIFNDKLHTSLSKTLSLAWYRNCDATRTFHWDCWPWKCPALNMIPLYYTHTAIESVQVIYWTISDKLLGSVMHVLSR